MGLLIPANVKADFAKKYRFANFALSEQHNINIQIYRFFADKLPRSGLGKTLVFHV